MSKKIKAYILCRKNHKNYKVQVEGIIYEKDNIKLLIIGNCKEGYNLSMLENGMNIRYYTKLKELYSDIDSVIDKIKQFPEYWLENAKKLFDEAIIEKE